MAKKYSQIAFFKTDRIHSFDVGCSTFINFFFDLTGRFLPEAGLTPNGFHPKHRFPDEHEYKELYQMLNRLQPLEKGQLATLHNACMKILSKVGVVFHEVEALETFNKHGFKVDGEKVFFAEDQVLKALETVPTEYTIQARDLEKSVNIGGDHYFSLLAWPKEAHTRNGAKKTWGIPPRSPPSTSKSVSKPM